MTAWQPLFEIAHVQPGERVLIHGAGGGVGSMAVQFAKQAGAHVIGTAHADKAAYLRDLGVDEHIDPDAGPFEERVREVDVVLDTVGGDLPQRSYGVLRRGGRLVTTAAQIPPEEIAAQAAGRGITVSGVMARPDVAQLGEVARRIDDGQVRVAVAQTYPLAQAPAALDAVHAGHHTGKIVILID
jgi:NADPH:quinone reductase-like Zn-dependent oxidoreductase